MLWPITTPMLASDRRAQIVVGDDPEVLRLRQRQQAIKGFLDHALVAVQREELLGLALAADGPEPRAAASSEDDRIELDCSGLGQ